MAEWHELSGADVLNGLETGRQGIDGGDARARLEKYGENVLEDNGRLQWWQVFLSQFKDLLVIILIAAAAVSMLTGDPESAMVIFAVLLLNAVLGTVQHQKAEKSLDSLKQLSSPEARVIRAGALEIIPSSMVVPGDILMMETGDLVAADGRLLEVHGFTVNESSLTGESLSVEKHTKAIKGRESAVALAVAAIPEALSSIVTIVQAMGTQKMAKEQAIIKDLKAVESLGCVSVICSDKTGTLTQNRMDVERVYINHTEQDVMWLGRSRNRMDVKLFLYGAVLNNNASSGAGQDEGDPMEIALLHMAREAGMIPEQVRMMNHRKREIPFDSARKLMTTVNEVEGQELIFVKGAVDVLLKKCSRLANPAAGQGEVRDGRKRSAAGAGDRFPGVPESGYGTGSRTGAGGVPSRSLSSSDRQKILNQNTLWSSRGLRVLALACRPYAEAGKNAEEEDLIFLGLMAMMDPPRPESRSAVASARQAGIRPVMITGDHKVTAMAIAERIGILTPGDMAATGAELDQMEEEDLDRRLEHISVYARVSPEHKIRIVSAWQRRGHIVAMTGDGVNDAPALKKADIGVAMGITGTEVSKDAASMILADDNFATIIKAVANGRNVYRNIKNAIQFLLSGNMAGILCVLYTSLLALPLPFAPVHLLFINLITDSLPAIAIGMEPPEDGLLKEPPRNPREGILTASFIRDILVQGGLIAAATMWAYTTGLHEGGPGRACTMAFSTLTLARLFHGFNCRSSHSIIRLGLGSNLYSVMAFQLGALLLAAVLFVPGLQIMFAAADLSLSQLSTIVSAAFLPTLVIQIHKIIKESIA